MRLIIALLVLCFCAGYSRADDNELRARFDNYVTELHKHGRFDGVVLVARGDQVIFNKAYGKASHSFGIPNTIETVFRLGSVSKPITSMIVLQLAAEGKLDLRDTVSKHLSEFPSEKGSKITIHHLLTHSSGLGHYDDLERVLQTSGMGVTDFYRSKVTPQQFVKLIGKMPINSPPGTTHSYSSMGYILLGAVIERVTGKSFTQNLRERICEPAGMLNTDYVSSETIVPRMASGYARRFTRSQGGGLTYAIENAEYRDQSNKFCTGGIHGTANDLFALTRAIWSDKLLSAPYRKKMLTVHSGNYGYGWEIDQGDRLNLRFTDRLIWHDGALGGFKASVVMANNGSYTIISLANNGRSLSSSVTKGICQIIDGEQAIYQFNGAMVLLQELLANGHDSARKRGENMSPQTYYLGADSFISIGNHLARKEFNKDAIEFFQLAISLDVETADLYYHYANTLLTDGRSMDAVKAFQKAVEFAEESDNERLKQMATEAIERIQVDKTELQQLFTSRYHNGEFNGTVLVARQNEIIYSEGFGLSNFDKKTVNQSDTAFYIASLSKQFTAAGVMILGERKKLSLDDKIKSYLPQLPGFTGGVTIRHLLTHTSGLPDYFANDHVKQGYSNEDVLRFIARQELLDFEPGTHYSYSNTGYVLLSLMIESVSGQSYRDFLHKHIFEPAGMGRTIVIDRPNQIVHRRAIGYSKSGDALDYNILTTGDGGIYSTANDLYRWGRALKQGSVLSPESLRRSFETTRLVDGSISNYGFGWNILHHDQNKIAYHTGSLRGFKSLIYLDVANDYLVVVLSNQGPATHMSALRRATCRILYDHPKK